MPDTKSKFLKDLINKNSPLADEPKSFSSERQHSAQAFNLHVEQKDGRRSEGFAWSHYSNYQWTEEGGHERLVVIFGPRAVEIEGRNLGVLITEIREGQLNRISELASRQCALLEQSNPDNEPIITSVKSYPDFEEMLREIKGEDERETRNARRVER
ncbi:MAG TPA: hypothetical protein VFA77_16645 [Candidatus Eisenbacteria bacterium]|nr:hypothetical protein [Candidatus Eisenbacteria bacterium]